MRDADRIRLWELVELLDRELAAPQPDWKVVRAAAKELWKRLRRAPSALPVRGAKQKQPEH